MAGEVVSATILVRDYYYRGPDGKMRTQRWIGDRCLDEGESPVVPIDWWNIQSVWTTLVALLLAMVKEAPKAMVVYGRS